MAVRIVRLGTPRAPDEGLRLGTLRRLPRGVPRGQYAARDFFDLWLPELAPSAPLVALARSGVVTPKRWAVFARRYRREMNAPATRRLLALVAAMSARTNLSVGCYCEDESRCHRSILRVLLREHGAEVR